MGQKQRVSALRALESWQVSVIPVFGFWLNSYAGYAMERLAAFSLSNERVWSVSLEVIQRFEEMD